MTGAHRAHVRHALNTSAKSAVHVLSVAVMWLIVLAILTAVISTPADQNFRPTDLYGVQRGLAY